jgi:hypothetical protein
MGDQERDPWAHGVVSTTNHQLEQTGANPGNSFAGFRFLGSFDVRAPVAHLDRSFVQIVQPGGLAESSQGSQRSGDPW